MRIQWFTAAVFMVGAVAAGAAGANVTETTTEEVQVGKAPSLEVHSDGGSVKVSAGTAGVVRVEARRNAATSAEARDLKVTVAKDGDVVRVHWSEPGSHHNRSVSFVIQAPPASRLRIDTGGGSVKVEGFQQGAEVRTGGGSLALERVQGALKLQTGGGSIHAQTVDGSVEANTGGGSISVSGRLRGSNRVSTGAGSVHVEVPADDALKVTASTGMGSAHNDFGLANEGRHSGRFAGSIGDGSAGTLELRTGAGSISLSKQ